jgi:hypothetical protein
VVGSRTSDDVDVEVTSELVAWVIVDIDSEVVMVSVVTGAVDIVVDWDTSGEGVALDDTSDEDDVAALDEDVLDSTSISLRDGVDKDTSSLDNEVTVGKCASDEDKTLLVGVEVTVAELEEAVS